MTEKKWDLVWKGSAPMAEIAEKMFAANGIDVLHREKGPEDVELFVPDDYLQTAEELLRDWTI